MVVAGSILRVSGDTLFQLLQLLLFLELSTMLFHILLRRRRSVTLLFAFFFITVLLFLIFVTLLWLGQFVSGVIFAISVSKLLKIGLLCMKVLYALHQ